MRQVGRLVQAQAFECAESLNVWSVLFSVCPAICKFDKLPTAKAGGFCYQQPMLKNLRLTRSPARVDAPTLYGI